MLFASEMGMRAWTVLLRMPFKRESVHIGLDGFLFMGLAPLALLLSGSRAASLRYFLDMACAIRFGIMEREHCSARRQQVLQVTLLSLLQPG